MRSDIYAPLKLFSRVQYSGLKNTELSLEGMIGKPKDTGRLRMTNCSPSPPRFAITKASPPSSVTQKQLRIEARSIVLRNGSSSEYTLPCVLYSQECVNATTV